MISELHPAVVHFAIALTVVGFLFEVVYLFLKKESLKQVSFYNFILGVLFIWLASFTGEEAEEAVEILSQQAKELLETHEEIGEVLPWVFTVLGIYRVYLYFRSSKVLHIIFILFTAIAILGLGYQGRLGGKMVYEYGVGVKSFESCTKTFIKEKCEDDE